MNVNLIELLHESLYETVEVSLIVLLLMVIIEFLVLRYRDFFISLTKKNRFWSYLLSGLVGITPGCMGIFAIDSFYMAGLLPVGALATAMITTLGDESFVLLAMVIDGRFPLNSTIILYASMFVTGIAGGYLAYALVSKFNMKFQEKCVIHHHEHDHHFSVKHFFTHHIYNHIIKKHILRIAIWVFVTVFILEYLHTYLGESHLSFISGYAGLLVAALIGLAPISGPHLIFIILFAQGSIPFSILFTNAIVQDGHGLLPIMGFSMRDTLLVKSFKFVLALALGATLFSLGF